MPIATWAAPGQYPLLVSVSRLGADGGPLLPAGGPAAGDVHLEVGQVEISDGSRQAR
jgi:hypothetical protein